MKLLLVAGLAESLINFRAPLIGALQSKGLEVHVVAPALEEGQPLWACLESMSLHVHSIPMSRTGTSPLADLKTLWSLWRLMRHIKPQAVLGYTIKPVIYGTLAAWLAGVPHRFALITGLGYAFQGDGSRGHLQELVQRMYSFALLRAQKVFFQNPDDQALFRKRGLLRASTPSCVVNGSGVDVASFTVQPLPQRQHNFLLIARLLGDKGVREFVAAARLVLASHPQTKFTLVGWIDENPDAIQQHELDEWVSSGVVSYLGRLSDVRPAIADCTVYVLPSYREGTPRTVLEAMAMGRAIITTDAPGCRETVVHGHNGLMVPVRAIDELARAMLRFVEEPQLTAIMGAHSREMAEVKYDVNKVNAVMLKEMGLE